MSWGAHGAMGELKSPLGMTALAALLPVAFGHSDLAVPAILPVARKLFAVFFPVTMCHSVLGAPCFLLLFSIGCPSFVGSCCTLGTCGLASAASDALVEPRLDIPLMSQRWSLGFGAFGSFFMRLFCHTWCGGKACVLAPRLHMWLLPRGRGPSKKNKKQNYFASSYPHPQRVYVRRPIEGL